ncbi:MAG: hypothetical protein AB7I18_13140 [Candidatus Berkiella sp.]
MLEQYIKQQEEMTRKMDMLTLFFKFKTFVFNAVTTRLVDRNSPEFKEIETKMDMVRQYMNENPDEDFGGNDVFAYIATSELFTLFPKPDAADTGYAALYANLQAVRDQSLLAHRFEMNGRVTYGKVSFNLHGGVQETMSSEMAKSYAQFVAKSEDEIVAKMVGNPEFRVLAPEKLRGILRLAAKDVQNVVLYDNEAHIRAQSQNDTMLLLAPTIKTGADQTHALSVVIQGDLCLIADKARKKPGVEIYRFQDKNGLDDKKRVKATEIAKNMRSVNLQSPLYLSEQFSADMVKFFNLKQTQFIPLQAQFGDNCTWSSSAKCLLLSALYLRVYEAAKQLDEVKKLTSSEQEQEAHRLAAAYAKEVQHQWTAADKLSFIKGYINKGNPDPVLLAYVLLKYENRGKHGAVVKAIRDTNLVSTEHLKQAQEMAYRRAEELIQIEYPTLSKFFGKDFKALAHKFCDLMMVSGKKNVEKVFNNISFVSFSPFKNAMAQLDNAITQAKSEAAKRKAPVLAQFAAASTSSSAAEQLQTQSPTNVDRPKKSTP